MRYLPDQISRLSALRSLNLSGAWLRDLPESFSELTQLRVLDLSDNYDLVELPSVLHHMTHLKALSLSNTLQKVRKQALSLNFVSELTQ
jgi:Leucine-rich repeat (LRR) protein